MTFNRHVNNFKFLFYIFLILIFVPNISYSQSPSLISISTSEVFYEEGNIILISGNVSAVLEAHPVTLQIWHQTTLVDVAQLDVAQDGSFTHTINAEGPLWQIDGEYVARVTYGVGEIAETSFEYVTKKGVPDTRDIFEVDAGIKGTFDVLYNVRGGQLNEILVDPDILGVLVKLETDGDGALTLNLPRDSIDAKKMDGSDDRFIILIDGLETPYEEVVTDSDSRKIIIEFEEGDSNIEIIGTFVIPEFGTVAILVLALTVFSSFVISTKNNLFRY